MRASFLESGQFFERPRARSPPGATKAKLASLLHADHQWRDMTLKDLEAQLAAESVLRCHRLQERFPGALSLVMSRKQARSGCWLQPYQLLNGS
jgi:hypothetical protein